MLVIAIFLKHRKKSCLALKEQKLEIEHFLSVFRSRNLILEKVLMSAILNTSVEWSYVWNRNINIVWKVGTVEHGCLTTLTDSSSHPLTLI